MRMDEFELARRMVEMCKGFTKAEAMRATYHAHMWAMDLPVTESVAPAVRVGTYAPEPPKQMDLKMPGTSRLKPIPLATSATTTKMTTAMLMDLMMREPFRFTRSAAQTRISRAIRDGKLRCGEKRELDRASALQWFANEPKQKCYRRKVA